MIKRLRLQNFRRHEEVELDFDNDAQIILISGSNGAGKSSILESITYALYGQGRYGRNNLDTLVRRGAELEGMQVDLEFEIADSSYRVERRRDNGNSTANLYCNDRSVATGPGQVTSEISKILGMDAVGFKLATIAQQKELDGLAKLGPAARSQQIRRLLRLDAITSAADDARAVFRKEKEQANNLANLIDFKALTESVETSKKALFSATTAYEETLKACNDLETIIENSKDLETTWRETQLRLAHAQGSQENAEAEVERLKNDLTKLVIPVEVKIPEISLTDLTTEITNVERSLNKAENAKQLISQKEMLHKELSKMLLQKSSLETENESLLSKRSLLESQRVKKVTTEKEILLLEQKIENLRQKLSDANSNFKAAKEKLERSQDDSPTCSHCGQLVTPEHRENELKFAKLTYNKVVKDVETFKADTLAATQELKTLKENKVKIDSDLNTFEQAANEIIKNENNLNDLKRRIETYQSQIERIQIEDYDLDDLYAQKAELVIKITQAQQASDQLHVRAAALNRQNDLRESLKEAQTRLEDSIIKVMEASISKDLQDAYDERIKSLSLLEEEKVMLNHFKTQKAVSENDLQAKTKMFENGKANEAKRVQHQQKAVNAANASKLLKDVADRLASQIRPALEGSVSQLLSNLSEGRFSNVKIDADYNIRVEDDGKYQPISEFSGGEMDLIALAVRLAIAQVVTERHGAGGSGFLILDEVFGSQDSERREAILTSLRKLKGSYGQILLISHVGGLEEAADHVIDVTRTEDGPSVVKTI